MGFRREQALLIPLPMYVNQVRLYRFQQADIGDLIVDKYPSSSIGDQLSSDQRLALADVHARLGKQFLQRRITLYFKDPLYISATLPCPYEIHGRAIAKQEAQSVYEDRFARSGLPAQDIEALLELHLQPIDYRKIYDI